MTASPLQEAPPVEGAHLVLYDGVCGLCNRLVQFLLERDRRGVFVFASLQSATATALIARLGGRPDKLTSFYVVADYRADSARLLGRSEAALFVAGQLPWPWRAALSMRVLPAAILDLGYDVVARSRYRIFGRLEHCLVPPPEFRRRFIDA
jgi:predicted DCC family thiol-disulfide oxidoreductase YuxK